MLATANLKLDELYEFKPELTRKADFKEFWVKSINEVRAEPVEYEKRKMEYPIKCINLFEVIIKGYNGAPLNCLYIVPKDVKGKMPVMVHYPGYGYYRGYASEAMQWAIQGYSIVFAGIRAQQKNCPDTSRYSTGCHTGWMALGLENPHDYYFKGVYLDCLRVIDFICSQEETDPDKICTFGESQGGALSLVVAALDKRVGLIMPNYPAFGDFEYSLKMYQSTVPYHPYGEIVNYYRVNDPKCLGYKNALETLTYFDVMNFAPDIMCPACFACGLNDTIVLPHTVFSIYNHINSEKEIHLYPNYGHEAFPFHEDERVRFASKYLQY